jgi:hypothetical protein
MYSYRCIFRFIKKNATRCINVSKFYYSIFIRISICFGRDTAHHQEPKTALATSGFSHVKGCWTCSWWTLSGTVLLDFTLWIVLWCTDPRTSSIFRYLGKLCTVASIRSDRFSKRHDKQPCKHTKCCSVVDASCGAQNSWMSKSLMFILRP